jgi:hypothetical protein
VRFHNIPDREECDFMTITIDLEKIFPIIFWCLAVLVVFVTLFLICDWFRRLFRRLFWARSSKLSHEEIKKRWQVVEDLVERGEMVSLRLAVMEADTVFDEALKSMSMPGSAMAERLKFASHKYYRLKKVWWAHKIRNQLAHDTTFDLRKNQALSAIKEFRQALREIGAI